MKGRNVSVKTDRWRFVNDTYLFDKDADPRENHDVAKDHPEVVASLRAKYEAYWAGLPDRKTH